MSEHEINSFLRAVLQELDRTARQAIRTGVRTVVLPSALGAGLALCGGCDDSTTAPPGDVTVQDIMHDSGIDTLPADGMLPADGALPDLAAPDASGDALVQPDGEPDGPVIYPILPPLDAGKKPDGPVIYPVMPPPPDAGKKADAGKKPDGPVIYPILPPVPDGGKKPDGPVIYPIMPPPP
jgi:hypothetical protein